MWIEQYKGCGCSIEASDKKSLPGYCAKHGGPILRRYCLKTITKKEFGFSTRGSKVNDAIAMSKYVKRNSDNPSLQKDDLWDVIQ